MIAAQAGLRPAAGMARMFARSRMLTRALAFAGMMLALPPAFAQTPPAAETPPTTETPAQNAPAAPAPAPTRQFPPASQQALPQADFNETGVARPQDLEPVFGQEMTALPRPILYVDARGTWEEAIDVISKALDTLYAALEKANVKPASLPMAIFVSADDQSFEFRAALVPAAPPPAGTFPADSPVKSGMTPGGRALKFTHVGPYAGVSDTYDRITGYLDEKRFDAQDSFLEEYPTDPRKTPPEKLITQIYVFEK